MIYHLALRQEWEEDLSAGGGYRRSTLGRSLEEVGYVHCSFAEQVQDIGDLLYRGRYDVVLLTIDPSRVRSEVVVEDTTGSGQRFPHVYGPIPAVAVLRVDPVPLAPDGRLDVDAVIGG